MYSVSSLTGVPPLDNMSALKTTTHIKKINMITYFALLITDQIPKI